ncbi:MAG: DUF2063 domain-containing protein [Pseudomonadales bacterium]|uniref:HvfC family RiPP maturation protein n=1 Tax=unclassified Ketobacter TaxID=2639109 RepID=UPI000C90569D|nr:MULTISPECIES: putative DNA-binding domain-containing protein [unclassified Ketobacter]MAA60336.1 DUF2063 domain-containing protein [Pseudomonadales bacterium]MEC8809870.1 putative DNA-binding domain-containing protein [Pseudomonadota bacterium]TNC84921.1 MAG: DUF2063 domain-containing protein [Alcanivorax sp.]HAG95048.1 DUF2063 domain-containing protein [Gammaproteobacteria bacterium]MAQ25727.1 DUF2063 domain-containing protein [Pseudomonadales bacterium]|tara:strand:- start:9439 stop:10218 length:780 start_codon:yes stop_codon:yes gene_type:complete
MRDGLSFKTLQYEFAAHLRNPAEVPGPQGVEDRRMQIYRDLFYNNVEGFISGAFPVLRSLTHDEKWHRMVRDFFSRYRCQSPYFLEISQEFLGYLQTARVPEADDFPFMVELAHYEWMELAVETDTDEIPATGFNQGGDLMQGRPLVSPLAHVVSYQYPVHRISVDFVPQQPADIPTFLIVYRDSGDVVRFMEINGVTARLLLVLDENPGLSGYDAVKTVAAELAGLDEQVVMQGGEQALKQLRDNGIILGTELTTIKG